MSPRGLRRTRFAARALAALCAALGVARAAEGHRLAPSLLELRELPAGRVALTWRTPALRPAGVDVRPMLPARCRPVGDAFASAVAGGVREERTLACGAKGLAGARLGVTGLRESGTDALVRVAFADGRVVRALLSGSEPFLIVPERESRLRVGASYMALGFEHIASGIDHLLLVLLLVLRAGGGRALVGTITAFTVGHSATLSLAALGVVRVAPALVEVAIGLTLLVLAAELASDGSARRAESPAGWRRPGVPAFGVGLFHGLGFAGSLSAVGLPAGEIPLTLFAFNVGIELGQLVFVSLLFSAAAFARALGLRAPVRAVAAVVHATGCVAAFWCFERSAALF